ncbi:MAG TPA: hypothetical protein VG501_05015 [Rhizomicrobium sp.]|nr:hypothetical protein [Rhizomicrobium sp.]
MPNRMLSLKPAVPRAPGWPKPKGPALRAIAGGKKVPHSRCYHVEWEPAEGYWTVLTDDGFVLGHSHDRDVATGLAIRAAEHDHGEGADVIVCVEQEDGGSALAWTPQSSGR